MGHRQNTATRIPSAVSTRLLVSSNVHFTATAMLWKGEDILHGGPALVRVEIAGGGVYFVVELV